MHAAWYERQGPPDEVLVVGDLPDPEPGPGEVRVRIHASGVNPGDAKKRQGWLGSSMPYPLVVPHSDGAGTIDAVGDGVDATRIGERTWTWGAQSYRPLGTAAEFVVVPEERAVPLPDAASFEVGAALGIPGLTAHRAVFADGPVAGSVTLVSGAAGAVGSMAVQVASWGGATVLATVRRDEDVAGARRAGATHVFVTGDGLAASIREVAPAGVDRVVEVDFGANARLDADVIAQGGTIAACASSDTEPGFPFWPMLFENVQIRLLGSDDFPAPARRKAAGDIVAMLDEGRLVVDVARRFSLDDVAQAHAAVEAGGIRGRVVVTVP